MDSQGLLGENPFERLTDDLVQNILDRVVWKASWRSQEAGEDKGRQRVYLESVCKRFSAILDTSDSLDWRVREYEQDAFFSYMLARRLRDAAPLRRIALEASYPENLMALLAFLIPQVLDSLEEIHLFVSNLDEPDVNWEVVFKMLQACKKLERLHIILWTPRRAGHPDYFQLNLLASSLKQFQHLRSLILLGFAVPTAMFASFVDCFPQLETLELHQVEGEEYDPNPGRLKELYGWGGRQLCVDTVDPNLSRVPSSIPMLTGLLWSSTEWVAKQALEVLSGLSWCQECREPLAKVPGCLMKLTNLTESENDRIAELVLTCLAKLSKCSALGESIARSPGCLQALTAGLTRGRSYAKGSAALALHNLAIVPGVPLAVVNSPGALQYLVDLLDDESPDTREQGADTLGRLASEPIVMDVIARMPVCLTKLVGFLSDDMSDEAYMVQAAAADALGRFLGSMEATRAVLAAFSPVLPVALERLVNLLVEEAPEIVQSRLSMYADAVQDLRCGVASCLEKLAAADPEVRKQLRGDMLMARLSDFSSKEGVPPRLRLLGMHVVYRVLTDGKAPPT